MVADLRNWLRDPLLALAAALLIVGGCDAVNDDEDLDLVAGSWRVVGMTADGTSVLSSLEAKYEAVFLTLREDGDGDQVFSVLGDVDGSTDDLEVSGDFLIDSDDDELNFLPAGGFGTITMGYAVSGSRLRLESDLETDADLFLALLQVTVAGDVDDLEVVLVPDTSE